MTGSFGGRRRGPGEDDEKGGDDEDSDKDGEHSFGDLTNRTNRGAGLAVVAEERAEAERGSAGKGSMDIESKTMEM